MVSVFAEWKLSCFARTVKINRINRYLRLAGKVYKYDEERGKEQDGTK